MSKKESRLSQADVVSLENSTSAETAQKLQNLLSHIEQNPKYAHLVQEAKNPSCIRQEKSLWQRALEKLEKLIDLVIAKPEDFHGRAIVSENLAKDCQRTAAIVSISSLLDAFSNGPLLLYAFKDLGALAFIITLGTNILILKYTNDSAAAASARSRYGKSWSNQGIAAFVFMSILQSSAAGIGTELLLNQSGLSQLQAELLIQKQIRRVEELKQIDSPQYKDASARCQAGEQELNTLSKSHPRWQSLYGQLYGQWSDRNTDWTGVKLEQLPLCRQVERLRQEAYQTYETSKKDLEQLLAIRVQMGNDLAFLKEKMPLVYTQHFSPSGELLSGIEATGLAIVSTLYKLLRLDLPGLGFALFFLLLSLITSSFACLMTISLSLREDTQKSFSDAVELQRNLWLDARRAELIAQHQDEVSQTTPVVKVQSFLKENSSANGNHSNS